VGGKEGGYVSNQNNQDIQKVVVFCEMSMANKEIIEKKAEDLYRQWTKLELKYFKHIAENLKNDLDAEIGGTWNVVVGRDFGSYFGYEQKGAIMFWINHICFLVFRFG
jgi:hypothetical protein